MNYQNVYNSLVERAKVRSLDTYYEKHHIIPKCLGGSNEKSNIVKLTAREHFLCHWLLYRIYPQNNKISYAFWKMCTKGNKHQHRYKPSSRAYQEAKEAQAYNASLAATGRKRPDLAERNRKRVGEKQSPSQIQNRVEKLRGRKRADTANRNKLKVGANNPMFGKIYINDGINQQTINKTDALPAGWCKGRRPRVKSTQNQE